jgi:membrane dipeptidase
MMQNNGFYDIHKAMTVCDTHCDTAGRILSEGFDLGIRSDQGHVDIPRLIEGGVDVQVFACWVGKPGEPVGHYAEVANKMIDALHSQFSKHSDKIELALTLSDVHKANENGKIAAIIGIEGGQAIEDDLKLIEKYYSLGVRLMTIVWGSTNWADAAWDPVQHNGLTDFGRDVIKEMNRLGMMVDVSHSADKTVWDVLEISSDPIIASHSCAKAICNHSRNLNDDLIRAISKSDGVICVNFYSAFLDENFRIQSQKGMNPEPPDISKVIEHIEYVIKVGGIDSVGLGSDFDGIGSAPRGLEDVSKIPFITKLLIEKGYKKEEISKIMGDNFLRVFAQVCGGIR